MRNSLSSSSVAFRDTDPTGSCITVESTFISDLVENPSMAGTKYGPRSEINENATDETTVAPVLVCEDGTVVAHFALSSRRPIFSSSSSNVVMDTRYVFTRHRSTYTLTINDLNLHKKVLHETRKRRLRQEFGKIPLSTAFSILCQSDTPSSLCLPRMEREHLSQIMARLLEHVLCGIIYNDRSLKGRNARTQEQMALYLHQRRLDATSSVLHQRRTDNTGRIVGKLSSVELVDCDSTSSYVRIRIKHQENALQEEIIIRENVNEIWLERWFFQCPGNMAGSFYNSVAPETTWTPGQTIARCETTNGYVSFIVDQSHGVCVSIEDKDLYSRVWRHHTGQKLEEGHTWRLAGLLSAYANGELDPSSDASVLSLLLRIFDMELDRLRWFRFFSHDFSAHMFSILMFRKIIMNNKRNIYMHDGSRGYLLETKVRYDPCFSLKCKFRITCEDQHRTRHLSLYANSFRELNVELYFEDAENGYCTGEWIQSHASTDDESNESVESDGIDENY